MSTDEMLDRLEDEESRRMEMDRLRAEIRKLTSANEGLKRDLELMAVCIDRLRAEIGGAIH